MQQEHPVLEDTVGVMGHPSMILVLAYVSFLHGKLLLSIFIWFLVYIHIQLMSQVVLLRGLLVHMLDFHLLTVDQR